MVSGKNIGGFVFCFWKNLFQVDGVVVDLIYLSIKGIIWMVFDGVVDNIGGYELWVKKGQIVLVVVKVFFGMFDVQVVIDKMLNFDFSQEINFDGFVIVFFVYL